MKKASHKILIIDDEPDVIRAVNLTITVQEPDWQVISAHRGETGLELVDTEAPDLVLLDLSMPGMHGFEVLEQIRLFSDVPVIILTAARLSHDEKQLLSDQTAGIVVKGKAETLPSLLESIRRIVDPAKRVAQTK